MTLQDDSGATDNAVSISDTGSHNAAGSPAGAAGAGAGGFDADAGATTLGGAARAYIAKVRGGEVGALPALLGLVVLVVIFDSANSLFLTKVNLANLMIQGAPTALIAMGLVFVLLLGEIDLSAGTASGVCAATMALALTNGGNLHKALSNGSFWIFLILMVLAIVVAALQKLWPAVAVIALGFIVAVSHLGSNTAVAIFLAVATGTAIGVLTGFLVAKVGIPSFVVTLALFLAWQGVLLEFIGEGGTVSTANFSLLVKLSNNNVPPAWGWVVFLLVMALYGLLTLSRSMSRRKGGLSAEPLGLVVTRWVVLFVICGAILFELNKVRGNNVAHPIKGVPYVVPVILVIMVFWTFILSKTSFGRHLYAVGGNQEAARRAGINVPRMRLAAFAISSSLAAIGGVLLASYNGGVPTDAGGNNTLLYAVGAAVIGGTSLFGGRGRMRDAVIGALVIAMIPNGLGLLNENSAYNFIITGMVLLAAASVDAISRRKSVASR